MVLRLYGGILYLCWAMEERHELVYNFTFNRKIYGITWVECNLYIPRYRFCKFRFGLRISLLRWGIFCRKRKNCLRFAKLGMFCRIRKDGLRLAKLPLRIVCRSFGAAKKKIRKNLLLFKLLLLSTSFYIEMIYKVFKLYWRITFYKGSLLSYFCRKSRFKTSRELSPNFASNIKQI